MNKAIRALLVFVGIILISVLVWRVFFRKEIVYGTNSDPVKVEEYREDCKRRGGELNECGSPKGNVNAVCYYVCELR